jgi:hypothetical protein
VEYHLPLTAARLSIFNKLSVFRRILPYLIPGGIYPATISQLLVPVVGKGFWEATGVVIVDNLSEETRQKALNSESLVADVQVALRVTTPAAWYTVI